MINSYDDTILYSDYVWNQIINRVRNKNAIVIYLSDHSENLGEDGIFGHGKEHWALHYPACWIWYSDKFKTHYPDKTAALSKNRMKKYNSDFLFHSIIDAADINCKYINHSKDIFR
jgi:glucan phosphoethanolaminetransferase (alkaline phosphatase superfamily)